MIVDEFNDLQIRKCVKSCSCKICDEEVKGKDIVYLKSFRLQAQPFQICLSELFMKVTLNCYKP